MSAKNCMVVVSCLGGSHRVVTDEDGKHLSKKDAQRVATDESKKFDVLVANVVEVVIRVPGEIPV